MSDVQFQFVPAAAIDLLDLAKEQANSLMKVMQWASKGPAPGVKIIRKGRRGSVLLISQDDLVAEALADPEWQSLTVISVQHAYQLDPGHELAKALSEIDPAAWPSAIPVRFDHVEEIQSQLRRLLPVYGIHRYGYSVRESRVPASPSAPQKRSLVQRLFPVAHRWKMREARNAFKDVLEAAESAPQVIDRENKQYLVIERSLLQNFERPLDAAELAAQFAHRELPPIVLDEDVRRHPEPELTFLARIDNG